MVDFKQLRAINSLQAEVGSRYHSVSRKDTSTRALLKCGNERAWTKISCRQRQEPWTARCGDVSQNRTVLSPGTDPAVTGNIWPRGFRTEVNQCLLRAPHSRHYIWEQILHLASASPMALSESWCACGNGDRWAENLFLQFLYLLPQKGCIWIQCEP